MAPCSGRGIIRRDVIIAAGSEQYRCTALIDADCWPVAGIPREIAGALDLPRPEWQALAHAERLVLTLRDSGDIYRMILDAITGRFLARQL